MYEKFFYLKEKPFHITPDPKFLYLSKKHSEAIDILSFGIKERKGFILLTGEVGTGKTTVCRALLEKMPKNTGTALILNPVLSEHDLIKTITADFGIKVESGSVKEHLDRLNEFLLKKASSGGTSVVIIDEAQNLNTATLEMIRLLSNLETEKEKLLQIILVGQPELRDKLGLPELRQLNQRIIVRYHLNPLDGAETKAYIQNRLTVAGGTGNIDFKDQALSLVFDKSHGIPRMINIICDRALTAAFIAEKRVIDIQILRSALEDLLKEGYLEPSEEALVPVAGRVYKNYIPHMALVFLIALIAGFYLGPEVYKATAGIP
ncbi:MAG: AAA family ATPase [Deltaproteobacteria bacterium]|nr:AAA family ATPase [Deltaproteobacteria bacterium]